MKHLKLLPVLSFFLLLLNSCSKDEKMPAPVIELSVTEKTIQTKIKEAVTITSRIAVGTAVKEEWHVGTQLISTSNTFNHVFEVAGNYKIYYQASNDYGIYKDSFDVKVEALVREGGANQYVTSLFEFVPAPGQFINKAPGNQVSAEGLVGKTGMVSLGAWGGYVVYGFDHSVPNKEGNDIDVIGNALTEWSEPGIIYVMVDDNGNGKPDDTWYELAGSEFGKTDGTYIRDYEVTYFRPETLDKDIAWTDNKGNTGFVKRNTFHRQAYYPEWLTGTSYTLKGSWLKTKVDPSRPTYVVSLPYDWGYSDNKTEAAGGGKVDISNAVDANGNKVNLKAIDFIKVQTGVLADGGWLGEVSTEVIGIKDMHFAASTTTK